MKGDVSAGDVKLVGLSICAFRDAGMLAAKAAGTAIDTDGAPVAGETLGDSDHELHVGGLFAASADNCCPV